MQPYGIGDKKRYTANAVRECKDSAVSRTEKESEEVEKAISGPTGEKCLTASKLAASSLSAKLIP